MKRQILSLILAMTMIVGLFTISVSADTGMYGKPIVEPGVAEPGDQIYYDTVREVIYADRPGHYYYALKYDTAEAKHKKAKWLPLYGEIDINKLMPKKDPTGDKTNPRIAIVTAACLRQAAKLATSTKIPENVSKATVTILELQPRFTPEGGSNGKLPKGTFAYVGSATNILTGQILMNTGSAATPVYHVLDDSFATKSSLHLRAGGKTSRWVLFDDIAGDDMLKSSYHPLGINIELKLASVAITENPITAGTAPEGYRAEALRKAITSSLPLKLKIPAIGKAPRVLKANQASGTSLKLSNRMEYAVIHNTAGTNAEEAYNILNGNNFEVIYEGNGSSIVWKKANPQTKGFAEIEGLSATKTSLVLIRTAATLKKPASMYQIIDFNNLG